MHALGRHHRRHRLAARRRGARDRPPQRAGAAGLPGKLLPPGARCYTFPRSRGRRRSPRPLSGCPASPSPLPGELYLWPGKRSYTGQPVAEIHTLGSPPLLEALLRTVCAAGRGRPSPANSPSAPSWPDGST